MSKQIETHITFIHERFLQVSQNCMHAEHHKKFNKYSHTVFFVTKSVSNFVHVYFVSLLQFITRLGYIHFSRTPFIKKATATIRIRRPIKYLLVQRRQIQYIQD